MLILLLNKRMTLSDEKTSLDIAAGIQLMASGHFVT